MNNIIAKNNFNLEEYEIKKYYEAGIVLYADEVKSLYKNSCSLKGSYVKIINNKPEISNMYIKVTEYRNRKILLNKKEILNISNYFKKGYILFPSQVYKKNNLIKLNLVLAKKNKRGGKYYKEKLLIRELRKEAKQHTKGICHI